MQTTFDRFLLNKKLQCSFMKMEKFCLFPFSEKMIAWTVLLHMFTWVSSSNCFYTFVNNIT